MAPELDSISRAYDAKYTRSEYFSYRQWVYRPFIKALVTKAGLAIGCRILDVGCGQGFFSGVFADLKLDTLGVDISASAVCSAVRTYGTTGARFERGDVLALPYEGTYDCVFARSLSSYNTPDLQNAVEATDAILAYLKPNGTMIFAYCTNLCPRKLSGAWRHHSLAAARKLFSSYPGTKVYFSLRVETLLLGRFAFSSVLTPLNALVSCLTGLGGELVAFVPRSSRGRAGGRTAQA